jgi:hypothetical protein
MDSGSTFNNTISAIFCFMLLGDLQCENHWNSNCTVLLQ